MSLSGNDIANALRAAGAATSGLVASTDKIADLFNEAMIDYGVCSYFNEKEDVAALVSECMMESAYFRTTVEYANTGPYQPYRGRTFIQLTWDTNYRGFGKWCKSKGLLSDAEYFVKNPTKLGELQWAALGGVYYFTQVMFHGKPLTDYSHNIDQVGKAVNLGDPYSNSTPNGQSARRASYQAVMSSTSDIVPDCSGKDPSGGGDTVHEDVFPTRCSITTPYGKKGSSWGKGYHPGDDWSCGEGNAEIGDKIYAVADGTIIYAGDARQTDAGWGSAFGIHVLNQWDDHGRTSIDAHMSKLHVKTGDRVKVGDLIGEKGATGNVTGPHDHHEQHTGTRWTDPDVKPIYPGREVSAPATDTGDEFAMSEQTTQKRTKAQVIKPNDWTEIRIEDSGDLSFGFGGGAYQVDARFVLTDISPSEELLVRAFRFDTDKSKDNERIKDSEAVYWSQGLTGGAGKSFRNFSWKWHVPSPPKGRGRRLRLQVQNNTDHDITIESVYVATWKAPLS